MQAQVIKCRGYVGKQDIRMLPPPSQSEWTARHWRPEASTCVSGVASGIPDTPASVDGNAADSG